MREKTVESGNSGSKEGSRGLAWLSVGRASGVFEWVKEGGKKMLSGRMGTWSRNTARCPSKRWVVSSARRSDGCCRGAAT